MVVPFSHFSYGLCHFVFSCGTTSLKESYLLHFKTNSPAWNGRGVGDDCLWDLGRIPLNESIPQYIENYSCFWHFILYLGAMLWYAVE